MSSFLYRPCWELPLAPALKLVLISLADQADDHGYCFPSVSNIQNRTQLSERSVQRAIRSLEEAKILSREERPGRSTIYRIQPENFRTAEEEDRCHGGGGVTVTGVSQCPPGGVTVTGGGVTVTPRSSTQPPENLHSDCSERSESLPSTSRKRSAKKPFPEIPEDDIEIRLPLIGGEYPIAKSQAREWGSLFPAVDVSQSLRNMRAWLSTNPERRKTPGGVMRFVVNWLTREQNSAARSRGGQPVASQRGGMPRPGDVVDGYRVL